MTLFRHHRFRLGVFLAAVIFTASGLPGIVAAAQGVQLQAPLCTPNGSEPAHNTDPETGVFDHCQICPLAHSPGADARSDHGGVVQPYLSSAQNLSKDARSGPWMRVELTPLNGRAPPFRI